MVLFSRNPCLIVNWTAHSELYRDLIREGSFLRFSFASPLQRFTLGRETPELLIREFTRMWDAVDTLGRLLPVWGALRPATLLSGFAESVF